MVAEANVIFADQLHHLDSGIDTATEASPEGIGSDSPTDQGTAMSGLKQDVAKLSDGAVMIRFKVRERRGKAGDAIGDEPGHSKESRRRDILFTLVCCHLWFNPLRPDIKTAQCRILFGAIEKFHERFGMPGGQPSHPQHPQPRRSQQEPAVDDDTTPNLILCGDFNSVPLMQPEFFPGPLQAKAMIRFEANGEVSPGVAAGAEDSAIYPVTEDLASGVYALITYGYVPPTHAEHPDTFIPNLLANQTSAASSAEQEERPLPVMHTPCGEWTSGYGRTMKDAYRGLGDAAPRFTFKNRSFSGVIDHIFTSSSRQRGMLVRSVLGFPLGANMAPPNSTRSRGEGDAQDEGEKDKVTSEDGMEKAEEAFSDFGPIPNYIWGSDHLALGVEVAIY